MRSNLLLMTDSYKLTHWKQYPPGTEIVYSYFESRGGKFGATVFFGLQYFLMEYLSGPVVTREKIEEAADFVGKHLGDPGLFNREGWEYILEQHGGRLPVVIRAVPEGMVVPTHNVLITIENTDPRCYWLTNYLETLLVEIWYPVTVATLSHEMRKLILGFLE
ncbi:MAG TPA: nicotinamide phosphoribosyltransferase domain-containing protein, partial [Chthonomonadales bacterium]|nr:nicotinamide phosphoribosyltransferase domain-containing protein [Chthonomonadales bacterium]